MNFPKMSMTFSMNDHYGVWKKYLEMVGCLDVPMFPLYTIPVAWETPPLKFGGVFGTCSTKVVSQKYTGCCGADLEARRFVVGLD